MPSILQAAGDRGQEDGEIPALGKPYCPGKDPCEQDPRRDSKGSTEEAEGGWLSFMEVMLDPGIAKLGGAGQREAEGKAGTAQPQRQGSG